jgi:hypothetical protein
MIFNSTHSKPAEVNRRCLLFWGAVMVTGIRSSIAIRAMQIRLFLEYHQSSDLCQDIVSCKSLDSGEAEQAASPLRLSNNPCAASRARKQVKSTAPKIKASYGAG